MHFQTGLFESRAHSARAIVRNYIAVDIENLSRGRGGETISIMAQFNSLSYYLPSGKSAVGVKAEDLKGGSVISSRCITPYALAKTACWRSGVRAPLIHSAAAVNSEH